MVFKLLCLWDTHSSCVCVRIVWKITITNMVVVLHGQRNLSISYCSYLKVWICFIAYFQIKNQNLNLIMAKRSRNKIYQQNRFIAKNYFLSVQKACLKHKFNLNGYEIQLQHPRCNKILRQSPSTFHKSQTHGSRPWSNKTYNQSNFGAFGVYLFNN